MGRVVVSPEAHFSRKGRPVESRVGRRMGCGKLRYGIRICAIALVMLLMAIPVGATAAPSSVLLDGAVSTGTADGVSSIDVSHTTGSGSDGLMLVSITANSYGAAATVSSVTFTPSGGDPLALTSVGSVENGAGRLAAIYMLLDPPSGVSGTVTVSFSGSVANGIVVGAANFAGVSQAHPLDKPATATGATAAISATVPTDPDDLVFDAVFVGYSPTPPTVSAGGGQSPMWDATVDRARGVASTKEPTGTSTQMSWTAASACNWAVVAVPINPVGEQPDPPSFNILLGRPTDQSVTANIIPDQNGEAYIEYGLISGDYSAGQIDDFSCVAGEPAEVVLDGLSTDTEYFYRVQFKPTGSDVWSAGAEHSFRTQRLPGEAFTFTIVADSHLGQYGGQTADQLALYRQTLLNAAKAHPDFHIDLGDTFAMDPSPLGTGMTDAEAKAAYYVQRPYLGLIGPSIPTFLVLGNHENEEGWNWDDVFTGPDKSLALVGMKYRKLYYPNPVPDGFYTGNTDPLPTLFADTTGSTYHEDYYSWTWGDALFVVLDPYHYSMTWPGEGGSYGGEGQDGEASGTRWDWTLGKQQYDWLKATLENSHAKYKFVFSHHETGGDNPYGRGGVKSAPYYEWGGKNADGTWGFDTHRPGWGVDAEHPNGTPIHQLMVENGVTVYFHGHDHAYAYEELDGVVYQECPKPDEAIPPETSYLNEPNDGGNHYPDAETLPASGHIRVTVSPSGVNLECVKTYLPGQGTNGEIAASHTVGAPESETYTSTLRAGWNLVAGAPGTSFPGVLFGWDGHEYASTATVSSWQGYWCKVDTQQTVEIHTASPPPTIALTDGWNLIGNSMRVPADLTLPAGRVAFAYDAVEGQYASVLTLLPGQGAWVKATAGEEATLTPAP
jgi:Calcineurin-like phosphoesterase